MKEQKCKTSPLCSHNTNGRDMDKPCSVEFVDPKQMDMSNNKTIWK